MESPGCDRVVAGTELHGGTPWAREPMAVAPAPPDLHEYAIHISTELGAVPSPTRIHVSRRTKAWIVVVLAAALISSGCSSGGAVSSAKPPPTVPATQSASQIAVWLAGLLGIDSPKWAGKVLAGPTCTSRKNVFCPQDMATTPDGRILALASFSGETKVFDVASRRLLLHEPASISGSRIEGRMGLWLSADGRFVARGISTEDQSGNEFTTVFQIWDIATGRAILAQAPTSASPWDPIDAAGIAPNGNTLIAFEGASEADTGWYLLSPTLKERNVLATHMSYGETPGTIIYPSGKGEWLLDVGNGYAMWAPPAKPSVTVLPCNTGVVASALDYDGELYACAVGGTHADGSDTTLIWDIAKKAPLTTLADRKHAGVVTGAAFFGGGQYLAILAEPTQAYDLSGPKNLLVYSVSARPAEISVTRIPGISAGWGVQSFGRFAFAMGYSVQGGVCCLAPLSGQR